jgi:hypothetical protein
MVYMPVIIPVLRKLGILGKVMENAFLKREGAVWRNVRGEELARLEAGASDDRGSNCRGEDDEKDLEGVLLIGQKKMIQ